MNSSINGLTDRPLEEVIAEAAQRASEKVRDRNRRMGWPLIVSDFAEDATPDLRANHSAETALGK